MQSKVSTDAFKKLIEICHKNNFLCLKHLKANRCSLHYGPLGTLLKRNIFNEWLLSHLNSSDVNIFPLEISNPREVVLSTFESSKEFPNSLWSDTVGAYDNIGSYTNTMPSGFAVYGPCVNKNIELNTCATSLELNILSHLQAWTGLSVVFFCPMKDSMNWFYHWSKQRYLWWRKYSSIPSKFSMSDVSTSPSGNHQLSLLLEFPWGKQPLESIAMYEGHSIGSFLSSNGAKSASVVVCETGLDLAVLAYLANSLSEKWRSGEAKNLFQLHYKLAPYKVCLFLDESDTEQLKKLRSVATHLMKEFKENCISVLPPAELRHPTSNRFDKFDEMGLPYTIVLNENSILTGIAGLRNRDTTLQEQVHITELTAKLLKYLKIR